MSSNNKISVRQLQILLVLYIFGFGIMITPRIVSQQSGQDGWLCILIAAAAAVLSSIIITMLGGMFPGKSFFEYGSEIISRPLSAFICILFIIRISVVCALQLRFFGEAAREVMLNKTPLYVTLSVLLLVCTYAAAKGYETRARLGELLIFIVILPLFFVVFSALNGTDFSNLMPALTAKPSEVGKGSASAYFAFGGIELCLLAVPFINTEKAGGGIKKPVRGTVFAVASVVAVIGILMAVVTVVTVARFGASGVAKRIWPVLNMMDTSEIPGSFFDRQGVLIMSFWIVSVFAVVSAGLFFISVLVKDITGGGDKASDKKRVVSIFVFIPVILVVAIFPKNLEQAFEYLYFLNITSGTAFMLVIPLLMLIIAKIRGFGTEHGNNNKK